MLNNRNHKYEIMSAQKGLVIIHHVTPAKISSLILYLKYFRIMIIPNINETKVKIIVKTRSMGIGKIISEIVKSSLFYISGLVEI